MLNCITDCLAQVARGADTQVHNTAHSIHDSTPAKIGTTAVCTVQASTYLLKCQYPASVLYHVLYLFVGLFYVVFEKEVAPVSVSFYRVSRQLAIKPPRVQLHGTSGLRVAQSFSCLGTVKTASPRVAPCCRRMLQEWRLEIVAGAWHNERAPSA